MKVWTLLDSLVCYDGSMESAGVRDNLPDITEAAR